MRQNAFPSLAAVLGLALTSIGLVSEAMAMGNGGTCQGQIVETKQSSGAWVVTGSVCSGFCPPVPPPQRVSCENTSSGPSQIMGGQVVFPKVCGCVTYGPDPRWPGSEMVVAVQIDTIDPNNPQSILCDVETRVTTGGQFHSAVCDFFCPQGSCTQGQGQLIVPTVRVRTCHCP
jgi:hypothetical protein